MVQAAECSEDELPDLNALLKQPIREQAGRKASSSSNGDSTTGKRRVRRLESKMPNASSRALLRQWDPDRDGIVFGPRVSPTTIAKREDLPSKEQSRDGKGRTDAVAEARDFRNSRNTIRRPSKSISPPQQKGRLTPNGPQTSKTSADKLSTSQATTLNKLGKKEAKAAPLKTQSTAEVDADTTDEDSLDESPATNDDSSEYQDSDQSDSLSENFYSELPGLSSSRTARIPREASSKRSGIAIDCRNASPEPHRPSRGDRQREPATRAEGAEPRRTAQRSPPLEQHNVPHDQWSSRSHTAHETLGLAHDLSNLRLKLDESSDSDEYQTPEETINVKGPCLTPNRRTKSTGLSSPRKQARIPATPHKPNTDIFWSQEFVDDWNDQHSRREPGHAGIPANKAKAKTGQKKEAKKSFAVRKDQVAQDFLSQLDNRITGGKLTEMAAATGGIKIVWSKTLNTTAGRANWRRETIRTTSAGTQPQTPTQFKHHASIELAEKVIDGEDRLLNVLAHEFCHLANFMINEITTNPHGKEFKAWAAKCSREFATRGINVTTKHTYEIDFKYIWTCDACKAQYKRHSKSIDPSRHRCGSCKGLLIQTKPVLRGSGAAGTKPSEYQIFMKEHMKIVRSENPGSPQKEVMKVVAEQWSKRMRARRDEATKATEVTTHFVDLSLVDGHGHGLEWS